MLAGVLAPAATAQNISSGLVAYWNLDALSSGQATDATGNHPGTVSGNAAATTVGKAGGALQMSQRLNGMVSFPSLNWQPTAFSVAFWINPYSHSDYSNQLISYSSWGGFVFHTDPNGGIHTGTDVNNRIVLGAGSAELNQWQHFVFTYEGGTGRLYKNGVLLTTRTGMVAPLAWNGFRIGHTDPRGTVHGKIDEVRIYNRAVSQLEVEHLMAYPHTPLTCVWNGTVSSAWANAANWQNNTAPTEYDYVVVNSCTTCPQLAANTTVANLNLNSASQLTLGSYTLTATKDLRISYGKVWSSNGGLVSGAFSSITHSVFEGDIRLEKTGAGQANWTTHNEYKGKTTIIHRQDRLDIAHQGGDTFHGELLIDNYGWGLTLGYQAPWYAATVLFKDKVTIYTRSSWMTIIGGYGYLRFEKDILVRNFSNATTFGGNMDFYGPVTLENVSDETASINGNSIVVAQNQGNGTIYTQTFHKPVTVSYTSNYAQGTISIGSGYGRAVFKSENSLVIGATGFRRGKLTLGKVVFEKPVTLNLSSGGTETYISTLELGSGGSFAADLTIKAPRIQLNGTTFNGDVSITKTGSGVDNSTGGNVFRKKITINNQAPAGSAINMATAADDVIQQ